jgi:hypothetical protein
MGFAFSPFARMPRFRVWKKNFLFFCMTVDVSILVSNLTPTVIDLVSGGEFCGCIHFIAMGELAYNVPAQGVYAREDQDQIKVNIWHNPEYFLQPRDQLKLRYGFGL